MAPKSSFPVRLNPFRRDKRVKGSEKLKPKKDSDSQEGGGASSIPSATSSQSITGTLTTAEDVSQFSQTSQVLERVEAQSHEQTVSPIAQPAFSVQQPRTTVSAITSTTAPTALTVSATPIPERLWNRAIDELKHEKRVLVEAYEKFLSSKLSDTASNHDASESEEGAMEQMKNLVKAGLEKTGKQTQGKNIIGDAMQAVLSAKDVIANAINVVPQATIAWSVFCFALQMALNPMQQTKANRDGVIYIISRMKWYWQLSSLLLNENVVDGSAFTGVRCELETRIVDLYKKLISYQMKSVCSYFRNSVLGFIRDTIKLDDWNDDLKAVQDAENALETDCKQYHNLQLNSSLNQLLDIARNQETKLLQEISLTLKHQAQREDEIVKGEDMKKDNKCLRDLCVTNPYDDMTRIERTKGGLWKDSYIWILSHQDFVNWRDNDETRLLWIKGDPGKGKTMLLIGVIKELQKLQTRDSVLLSYFFCQGTDSRLNNATAVLRGLMYQLIIQQQSLISHLHEQYDKQSQLFEGINAFDALSNIFIKMLSDIYLTRIYFVIDALDECESGLSHLLRLIDLIVENASASSAQVKWLISSRNRPDIQVGSRINNNTVKLGLELNAESISAAVDAYIRHKVSELSQMKNYDSKLRDQVRDQLHEKANKTFLWVALVCKELGEIENWDVLRLLQEVPSDLTLLYARMMEQIRKLKGRSPMFCMQILSTSTLAYRPLHLLELAVLADLPDEISYESENLRKIIHMCGSLLAVRDDTVYFIHQSAKDYLSIASMDNLVFPGGRIDVHRRIVLRSLHNMSGKLHKDIYNLQDPGVLVDQINPVNPDPLAQIRYACIYWIRHLCDIDNNSHDQVELCISGIKFLKKHFLHWLEALSLMRETSQGITLINALRSLVAIDEGTETSRFLYDARRFVLQNRLLIDIAPLQLYSSAIIFAPETSIIRNTFKDQIPRWICKVPKVPSAWSPELQTLEGHSDFVNAIAFSRDGRLLASASGDGTVRFWDPATGEHKQTLEGHSGGVNAVAFSHDGKQLASASDDYTVRLWDPTTGELKRTLEGHSRAVNTVAFSHDGRHLASASDDGTFRLWDPATGEHKQTLEGHSDWVIAVTFSHDGRQLASASRDSTVRLWDPATGEHKQTLEGHRRWVYAVAFPHDGRLLASASGDGTVRLWDPATGEHKHTFEGHGGRVTAVAFSYDGQQLASASDDYTVRLWDPTTGEHKQTFEGHSRWVNAVAFSPDDRHLASASDDGTVRLWDPATDKRKQAFEVHGDSVNAITFSHDGRQLASASADHTVRLWDPATGEHKQTLEGHSFWVNAVAFSHDGRKLASASVDRTVRLWDSATGEHKQMFEGHNDSVNAVAFSHDGRQLASASYDRTVRLWDIAMGEHKHTFEGHSDSVNAVAFSHDGQQLASASDDRTVRLWDLATDEHKRTFDGHTNSVNAVAFSHDGRQLASASSDGTVRLWDPATGEHKHEIKLNIVVSKLYFSSDYQCLETDRGVLQIHSSLSPVLPSLKRKSTDDVFYNGHWITRNRQNLLWLPFDYRGGCSAFKDNVLVIGQRSGMVNFIGFKF